MRILILVFASLFVLNLQAQDTFSKYKGIVVDKSSGKPLAFANISLSETNIATVSNNEGEFSLKVSTSHLDNKILVHFVGYQTISVKLSDIIKKEIRIEMQAVSIQLPEISVISKDADALVRAMFDKMEQNYLTEATKMTAFYRETIRKGRSFVSVSEAVVDIHKQAYPSYKSDMVKLYKSRKKTDYNKIDTLLFKLMGGPYNALYLDIMKQPELIFTKDMMSNYKFSFDRATYVDNQLIYVVDFVQTLPDKVPLYAGKLYIDAHNIALKSAVFDMNISNRVEASKLFVVKKPFNARVYPVEASYRMDYFEQDGKWYFGHSRIELGLRINWKRKLFNTTYHSVIEMAVTDWQKFTKDAKISRKERVRTNVVVADEAAGFADPKFWGKYNIIEPNKPIENAIKKIQKQLRKKQ